MSLVSRRIAAHHRPRQRAGIAGHDSTADRSGLAPDRQPGSVPEIQAVQTRAFKPAVMPAGKVHREIDMSAQGLKTGVVELPDRTYVAGYRPDR